MFHKDGNRRRTWKGRAFSLFLTAVLLLGSMPGLTLPASAHWADSYLDQMVDWGVMRADQISNPDTPLTRAEFMAIINRAYGYTEVGPMPFEDVSESDWFYDDVAIAYNAGYMKGTSKTTAAPNSRLTREQAICILGRNMMLKEMPGEDMAFADSRSISGWARGMVKAAVNNYIVTGYPDDTFRPKDNITKGQMAVLVSQCLGTPVNGSGAYELGDVSGNVTITAPNVTLRNTTISGDLYVSGGVGLGGVKLENVNVLGRIVVSGTGESEGGAASVIMRNVNAEELLVDNMRKKYVTVRADGVTEIAKTTVRTNAYLEDNNTDDKGLLNITLEGKSGTRLDLAGRIKKVLDKTPDSFIQVAKGTVRSITVDETATNSVIQINRNTEVKELNLDVAANVNGEGDVGKLNINAPGSTVTMLPDDIYIRPGITGNVNGTVMDSAAAEESSLDPRLLSGYPAASDVAPTGFRADFAGNKKGTIYWAVSDIADGSIGAEDLIAPPSYGSKAVRGGSVGVPAGDTVGSTQISGLTVGGSYYLSAVLVDDRDERSPVKVISFTTPDNSKPAFAQGYPYMSLITNTMAQVTVMPTKTCKMYYAVLLKGAPAPTAAEMRSASVTGNLGYGIVDVVKNTERVVNVSNRLQELKEYTLYLWLSDADGVNSSAVVPVQFKTVDKTPPKFNPDPDPRNAVQEDESVKMTAGLNEPGTIYWVAVAKDKIYPPPASDPDSKENVTDANGNLVASLTSQTAKIAVKNHTGASIYGSVKVSKADTEVDIDVKNLKPATAYDFYYVAEDTAGNFSDAVKKITIRTRDNVGPVVTQYFRNPETGNNPASPRIADEIILQFNEEVKVGASTVSLLEMKPKDLKEALENNFKLYYIDELDLNKHKLVESKTEANEDGVWVDYSQVTVRQVKGKEGCVEVVFLPNKAIKLASGRTYYFRLSKVTDMTGNNPQGFENEYDPDLWYEALEGKKTDHVLGTFTTAEASITLGEIAKEQREQPDWQENTLAGVNNAQGKAGGGTRGETDGEGNSKQIPLARVDGSFFIVPDSTQSVKNTTCYDIALFSGEKMDYDLYYRIMNPDTKDLLTGPADGADANGWIYMGNIKSKMSGDSTWDVTAAHLHAQKTGYTAVLPKLNEMKQGMRYEFAVSATRVGDRSDADNKYESWGEKYKVQVGVVAGIEQNLDDALRTADTPDNIKSNETVEVVSAPNFITLDFGFNVKEAPRFVEGPSFEPYFDGEYKEQMTFKLNNTGTLYYRIVPKDKPLSGTEIKTRKDVEIKYKVTENNAEVDKTYTIGNDTTVNSGITVPAGYGDGWQGILWDVVYKQTTAEDCGKLESDDALEYYSVLNPSADAITSSRSYESYKTKNDEATIKLNDKDVKWAKNSDYFIYIVLRSDTKEDSPVYLYEFTTGDTPKPKISATQEMKDLRVTTGSTIEDADSKEKGMETKFDWMILQRSTAQRLLGENFTIGVETNGGPSSYPNVTTLEDALKVSFNSDTFYGSTPEKNRRFGKAYDGFSVFDVLAGADVKTKVYEPFKNDEILNLQPYVTQRGLSTKENKAEELYVWKGSWYDIAKDKFGDNVDLTEYLILVVGRNAQSKDTDIVSVSSFRAVSPVEMADKSTPKLRFADGNINFTGWDEKTNRPVLDGNISLSFELTRALSWTGSKPYNNEQYVVKGGSAGPDGTGDDATVGLLYNVKSGHPFTSASGGPSDFDLDFSGLERGDTYTILPNGRFYAKGASSPGGPLRIKFTVRPETRKNEEGNSEKWWIGRWEVTYEGNDSDNPGKEEVIGFAEVEELESVLEHGGLTIDPPKLRNATINLGSTHSEATIDLDFSTWIYSGGVQISDITSDQSGITRTGLTVTQTYSPAGTMYGIKIAGITGTTDAAIQLLANTKVYADEDETSDTMKQLIIRVKGEEAETSDGGTVILRHITVLFDGKTIEEKEDDRPVIPPKLTNAVINDLDGGNGTAKIVLDFSKPLCDASGKVISDIACKTASGKAVAKATKTGSSQYTLNVSGIDKTGSTITVLKGIEVYDATGKAHAQKDITIEVKLDDGGSGVLTGPTALNRAWAKVTADDLKAPIEKTETQASSRRR